VKNNTTTQTKDPKPARQASTIRAEAELAYALLAGLDRKGIDRAIDAIYNKMRYTKTNETNGGIE